MGAWIEIDEEAIDNYTRQLSLLSWERGLKSMPKEIKERIEQVAPLVGAWIEITVDRKARCIE